MAADPTTLPPWARRWVDFVEMYADEWSNFRWTFGEVEDPCQYFRNWTIDGRMPGPYLTFHNMADISCKAADFVRPARDNHQLWVSDVTANRRDRWKVIVCKPPEWSE